MQRRAIMLLATVQIIFFVGIVAFFFLVSDRAQTGETGERAADSGAEVDTAADTAADAFADADAEAAARLRVTLLVLMGLVAIVAMAMLLAVRRSPTPRSRMQRARFGRGNDARKKKLPPNSFHARALALERAHHVRRSDYAGLPYVTPLVYKLSTWVLGDQHFDESFAVEFPDGTFLGQTGVSIAAPINRYHPDKAAALAVWLFDHATNQTHEVVLASEYALRQRALRQQLDSRGEVLLAAPDVVHELVCGALALRLCVLGMEYGVNDTLALRSFFDYVVVEIAVWPVDARAAIPIEPGATRRG